MNSQPTSLTCQDETGVRLRGCYYDAVRGLGIFGTLKPALSDDEDDVPDASIGLRYSTPAMSAGVVVNPFAESLKMIWLVSAKSQTGSPDESSGFSVNSEKNPFPLGGPTPAPVLVAMST